MTEVGNLDDLANKIASGKYPNIANYAKAQAAATQSQEAVIRRLEEDVLKLKGSGAANPPTPDLGNPIFDGRATRLTTLTGATSPGTNTCYHDPEVWGKIGDGDRDDGLYFMGDDIRLVADPTYTKVYYFETNGYSQNPHWADACCASAEMTHDYTLTLGQPFWLTNVTKLDPANVLTPWQTLLQVAYPTQCSPPFGIYMRSDGWGFERHSGVIYGTAGNCYTDHYESTTLLPWDSIKGKWIEYILGVNMTQTATGFLRIYTRVKENGETQFIERYRAENEITYQWPQGQSPKLTVMDKLSHYWGYSGSKSGWPTQRVWHRGQMKWATEAEARASMG